MEYLKSIYKIAHDARLSDEESSKLKEVTDRMALNRDSDLSFLDCDDWLEIKRKLQRSNQLEQLRETMSRHMDFDNTGLSDGAAVPY